jgi:hypothetical protein
VATESRGPAAPASTEIKNQLDESALDQVSGGTDTAGAGAGKIKFNEFTIEKTTDAASPLFVGLRWAGRRARAVRRLLVARPLSCPT